MLSRTEEIIRTAIKKSDVPFLGLIAGEFTSSIRQAIEIATLTNPTVSGYIRYLTQYPAIFSVNLTAHIMEGMGQGGHFDLYPHIQRAIATDQPLTKIEKDKLWKAFRKSILTLGFEASPRLSGSHFMANEYLRQTGVPLAFADDLAEKMIAFAKRIGLPDADDPEAIKSWQKTLESRLDPPFSVTAKNAVSHDTEGYYTQAFLRVHNKEFHAEDTASSNALERAMTKAFRKQSSGIIFRRALLPYISLNQGSLGIFIPGGDDRNFEFQLDGATYYHQSGIEDQFFPLQNPLAHEVIIKEESGHVASKNQLWEDSKPNRLLVFNNNGCLKSTAQLNQGEPLELPPGNYYFLSRFSPVDIEVENLWENPALYGFPLIIYPNQEVIISNGPARLRIQGEAQPFASWISRSRTTKDGVEFLMGELKLFIEVPNEWSVFAGMNYVLRLSASGNIEKMELKFSLDESGKVVINIKEAIESQNWEPGFWRILAEVSRPGESRSLLRCSTLYWFGLSEIKEGMCFVCQYLPVNIQLVLNENIRIEGNKIKPINDHSKTLRLVFKLDERRHQTLTWNVPGIFIEVENTTDSGSITRLNKPVGSVEVVSLTSNKIINISASDSGFISLGDWSQYFDFSKCPTKRLPASLLASRLTGLNNKLVYRNERTSSEIELLKLVQPHFIESMKVNISSGQLIIHFKLPRDLQVLRVIAEEVISGDSVETLLEANSGAWINNRFGRAQLRCIKNGEVDYMAYAYFDLSIWPSGAWVFRFDGQVAGIVGHLVNEREDVFAAGLICGDEGNEVRISQLLGCLTELTDKQSLGVLWRVQAAMLPCYAQESWETVKWLLPMWQHLLSRWKGHAGDAVPTLLDTAAIRTSDESSPSWMLQQISGAVMPELYAMPALAYRQVNQRSYPIVRVLRAIADLKLQYPLVFPDFIHIAAASGFSNFQGIARGEVPNIFHIDKYCEALHQTGSTIEDSFKFTDVNFQPGAGDWLGPVHYKFAMRTLEASYERSLNGNEIRRGQAIGLCLYTKRQIPVFNERIHKQFDGKAPHIVPWPDDADEPLSPEASQKRENLYQISHLLSLLAYYCRLGARSPEKLDLFLSKLMASSLPVVTCLSYLLQVGEGVFAYYLFLWEFVIRAERIR